MGYVCVVPRLSCGCLVRLQQGRYVQSERLLIHMLVFGAGCILGPVRVLVLEPNLGKRYAELLELIFMIVGIKRAAERTAKELQDGAGPFSLEEPLKQAAGVMCVLA